MAERLARELSERLGEDAVTAHHGSLSKEKRLDAEDAPQERAAEGARRHGVARARHRHRPRRSRLPDRIAASHRHVPPAGRPIGPHGGGTAEGPAVSGVARRSHRVRGAAARGASRRARSHRVARRAARRPGAADRRRNRVRGLRRRRAVHAGSRRLAVSGAGARPSSTRSCG